MELKNVALVIVDISGYTKFIKRQNLSLLHAEDIITQLLETVIDTAQYPLHLNKLEGDAALLYALVEDEPDKVLSDVARQAISFFPAFQLKARELSLDTSSCGCDACTHIERLKLKVFLHYGQAVIKRVRHFEELAGENVVLIHRLLKNSVPADEYLLMTQPFLRGVESIPGFRQESRMEHYEISGRILVEVFYPDSGILSYPIKPSFARRLGIAVSRILHFFRHLSGISKKKYHHIPNRGIRFIDLIKEMF